MILLQIGHSLSPGAHWVQDNWCPHGKNTTPISFCQQILHCNEWFSFSLSEDESVDENNESLLFGDDDSGEGNGGDGDDKVDVWLLE